MASNDVDGKLTLMLDIHVEERSKIFTVLSFGDQMLLYTSETLKWKARKNCNSLYLPLAQDAMVKSTVFYF